MFGLGPQISKADESSFSSSVDGDTFGGKAANDNKGDFQKNPAPPYHGSDGIRGFAFTAVSMWNIWLHVFRRQF